VQKALTARGDVQVLDIGPELRRLYRHYLEEAQGQALLGALGVVLLMAASLRSGRRLLAVCQPLALAVLLTMGGLALAGVQLGILHLVGLLLVVAVGSNYALFFDMLQQQSSEPDSEMLASLLLANLTTVASFGLIALSNIPALAAIGVVVAPGALLALLLSAAFVRVRQSAAP
jgi:predicted exporter